MKHFFILSIIVIFTAGCRIFIPVTSEKIDFNNNTSYYIFVQGRTLGWEFMPDSITSTSLSGKINPLTIKQVVTYRSDPTAIFHDEKVSFGVVVEVKREFAGQLESANGLVRIDNSQIAKTTIYRHNPSAKVGNTAIAIVGTSIVLVGGLAILCNCPHVFADTPEGELYQGEVFTGATHPQLERPDWLPLPSVTEKNGRYHLKIANENAEIQHMNLAGMLAVDHPAGQQILFDKYGKMQVIAKSVVPESARDACGLDQMDAVSHPDNVLYVGNEVVNNDRAEDGLVLKFRKPANAQIARLIVRARTGPWLGFAHQHLQKDMGKYAPMVRKLFLKKSGSSLRKWTLEQNIPISVFVRNTGGAWNYVDYFELAGGQSLRSQVLEVDLSQIQGETVEVKLAYGFKFWEIDWVALDFTNPEPLEIKHLPLVSAEDHAGQSVKALLNYDDQLYNTQKKDDFALLQFESVPLASGLERSLFFQTKGHYRILHETTAGKPTWSFLMEFRRPDAFPKYAQNLWHEYQSAFNLQPLQQP